MLLPIVLHFHGQTRGKMAEYCHCHSLPRREVESNIPRPPWPNKLSTQYAAEHDIKVIRLCLVFFVPLTFQNLPWKLHVVEHALLLLAMDNYVSVVLFSYTKIFRIIVVRTRNKLDCKFEVIFWILYLISFPPHGERIIIQSIFKTFQTFLYESTCWIRTKRQGNIPIQGVRSLSPHSSSVTLIHTRSLQSWLQRCPYQTSIKSKNHERV